MTAEVVVTVDLTTHELLSAARLLHHLEARRRTRLLRDKAQVALGARRPPRASAVTVTVSHPTPAGPRAAEYLTPTAVALAAGLVDAGALRAGVVPVVRGSGRVLPWTQWRGTPPVPTTRFELTLTAT